MEADRTHPAAQMPDHVARDVMIESQPILWAQAMLEEADKARSADARDAILARVGMVLYSRYAVTFDPEDMRRANQRWNKIEEVPS